MQKIYYITNSHQKVTIVTKKCVLVKCKRFDTIEGTESNSSLNNYYGGNFYGTF